MAYTPSSQKSVNSPMGSPTSQMEKLSLGADSPESTTTFTSTTSLASRSPPLSSSSLAALESRSFKLPARQSSPPGPQSVAFLPLSPDVSNSHPRKRSSQTSSTTSPSSSAAISSITTTPPKKLLLPKLGGNTNSSQGAQPLSSLPSLYPSPSSVLASPSLRKSAPTSPLSKQPPQQVSLVRSALPRQT